MLLLLKIIACLSFFVIFWTTSTYSICINLGFTVLLLILVELVFIYEEIKRK